MVADVFNLVLDTWVLSEMYNNLPKVIYLSFKLAIDRAFRPLIFVLFLFCIGYSMLYMSLGNI